MDWAVVIVTFLATVTITGALFYAFLPDDFGITGRLSRLLGAAAPIREAGFKEKQKERLQHALASIGTLVSSKSPSSRNELLMVRAGFRRPEAMQTINGLRLLLPIAFVAIVFFSGLYRWNPVLTLFVAALGGYVLPELWLVFRIRARQHRLRLAVPDGLDLLVICVEAGLGLDHALLRVAQELQITHRELSDELQLVTAEMRLGKTRTEALRELARR